MAMKDLLHNRHVIIGTLVTTMIAAAFATDYLLREWLLFVFLALFALGCLIPRTAAFGSAIWAGTLCGAVLALAAALYRSVYGG